MALTIQQAFFSGNIPKTGIIDDSFLYKDSNSFYWYSNYYLFLNGSADKVKQMILDSIKPEDKSDKLGYYYLLSSLVIEDNKYDNYKFAKEILSSLNPWILYEGYHLYKDINFQVAIDSLIRCVDEYPFFVVAQIELMILEEDIDARMTVWERIPFEKLKSYVGLNWYANDLANKSRFNESLEKYKLSLGIKENEIAYYEMSQLLHHELKSTQLAIDLVKKGMIFLPKSEKLMFALGAIYFDKKDYAIASPILEKLGVELLVEKAGYLYLNILINLNKISVAENMLEFIMKNYEETVDMHLWQIILADKLDFKDIQSVIDNSFTFCTDPERDWLFNELEYWDISYV